MKHFISVLLVIIVMLSMLPLQFVEANEIETSKQNGDQQDSVRYSENEIFVICTVLPEVVYSENGEPISIYGIKINNIEYAYGTNYFIADTKHEKFPYAYYQITLSDSTELQYALDVLNAQDDVVEAQQNFAVKNNSNDMQNPYEDATIDEMTRSVSVFDSSLQTALDNVGVDEAWEGSFTGSTNVNVAVLCTGSTGNSEVAHCSSILRRFNATNPDDPILYDNDYDNYGKGTGLISVIAAATNGIYISGVCKSVTMYSIKVIDEYGFTYPMYLTSALNYIIYMDIDIALVAIDMPTDLNTVAASFSSFDGLIVTPAGDQGTDITGTNSNNGAKTNLPSNRTIIVGACDSNDDSLSTSNYSSTYVTLFAQGTNIYAIDGYASQNNILLFDSYTGTDYAAAIVAGACALIASKATHLSPQNIKDLFQNYTNPSTDLTGKCVSGGALRINNITYALYNAVRPAYSKGDVNGDTTINSTDYAMCKRIVLHTYNPTTSQFNAADIDGDGAVTLAEAEKIKEYYLRTYYFPPY